MTGAELKQIREDLSEAMDIRLSLSDMARICGLSDPTRNGQDTWRKWEEGDGPSGPVATLLALLRYASPKYQVPAFGYNYALFEAGAPIGVDQKIATAVIQVLMRGEIIRRLS